MCAISNCTCSSPYWPRSGRGGQLISVEAPAGVQAVWLTLPRCFSWWQEARAEALPETQRTVLFYSLSCGIMKRVVTDLGLQLSIILVIEYSTDYFID